MLEPSRESCGRSRAPAAVSLAGRCALECCRWVQTRRTRAFKCPVMDAASHCRVQTPSPCRTVVYPKAALTFENSIHERRRNAIRANGGGDACLDHNSLSRYDGSDAEHRTA